VGIQGRARQGRGEGAVHGGISVLLPSPQRFEWLGAPQFPAPSIRWPIHGHGRIEFQVNTPPDRGVFAASDLTRPSPAFHEVMSR
jgi:hypothetical protein